MPKEQVIYDNTAGVSPVLQEQAIYDNTSGLTHSLKDEQNCDGNNPTTIAAPAAYATAEKFAPVGNFATYDVADVSGSEPAVYEHASSSGLVPTKTVPLSSSPPPEAFVSSEAVVRQRSSSYNEVLATAVTEGELMASNFGS